MKEKEEGEIVSGFHTFSHHISIIVYYFYDFFLFLFVAAVKTISFV